MAGDAVKKRKLGSRTQSDRMTMMHAEMELAAGNANEAAALLRQILASDPNHVGALEILAKAQWQAANCGELLLTLGKLIELNPYEPGYHSLQAGAFQSLGLCGDAVKSYLRAVDLGMPRTAEMDAMLEDLKAWQGSLVAQLLTEDVVFRAAYAQDPVAACAAKGFDFAIEPESTDRMIQERQTRAVVFARPS